MDHSRAFASDEVDMAMSDQYSSSSSSDDGRDSTQTILPGGMDLDGNHPTVLGSTGQLSPASTNTNVEVPIGSSSAPTMVNSASSSCTESWTSGNADRDENENDIRWEQGSDDVLAMTKLEPMDDEFNFEDYQPAPLTPGQQPGQPGAPQAKQKRPRGRPRKHPLTPAANAGKVTKGRSKTGCITCRKRKKKCDEAKPRCMNCEKNAVVCEGYHEKQIWKSGREKAEEERLRRESLPQITLHPLFHAVETTEDKIFWKHYIQTFSNVLTVEGEAKNAFKDIILHLANRHQGLMHSLLAVSSKHIDYDAPSGSKLLQDNPTTTREALQERSDYHHDEAMKHFHEDMANTVDKDDPEYQTEEYQTTLAARYGQILCLLLQTRAEGNPRGEHRLHLQAYQTLIQHSPPQDGVFKSFITEFFQYHIYADDLMWHPESMTKRLSTENWQPTPPFHTPRLLGVMDGLFNYFAQITTLRNKIRENMTTTSDPPVDYNMLFRAAEIDTAIREWAPNWPAGDSRNRVGLLYQLAMSIYLFRTTYPPSLTPCSRSGMSSSVDTPQRRASMAASVISTQSAPLMGSHNRFSSGITQSCPSSRHPSRTSSMHETNSHMSHPAPPPRRRTVQNDRRLAQYVEDSLTILETFGPSDPAQTLLLIPCIIVGIASFDCEQRERVRRAIKAVHGYTGLRNCGRVSEVLEEVWARMDGGDWVSVWDWQRVARSINVDVLCT